jgi:hypothetical protein
VALLTLVKHLQLHFQVVVLHAFNVYLETAGGSGGVLPHWVAPVARLDRLGAKLTRDHLTQQRTHGGGSAPHHRYR